MIPKRKTVVYSKGFTLITTIVAIAIFAMLTGAVATVSIAAMKSTRLFRDRTAAAALADAYIELARNLPYSQIGTLSGNPHGNLPDLPNAVSVTYNNVPYKIFYEVTYVDDPADGTILAGTDFASNDYKQVKINITNQNSSTTYPFTTTIVPKGLENLSSGGALFLTVFDAVGQPIPNASLQIINTTTIPSVNLLRETDSAGNWIEVGLPNATSSYHIVATKAGYSTDQTLPSTASNPNPTKPDATISNGQVTQISFSIDKLSNLDIDTVNTSCTPLSNIGIELRGSKLVGTPSVLKNDTNHTTSGGRVALTNIEWDSYTPLITSGGYMIYGSSPIQQINLLPDSSQRSTLILGPITANSLLVIVKDAANNNPLENALVTLRKQSSGLNTARYTEGSIWSQLDWTGGGGQADFTNSTKYYSDDSHVDVLGSPTGVRLVSVFGAYASQGSLESSTFDTGTASTSFTTLSWTPTSQSASTTLAFQIAANNDNASWNYVGPDGTSGTYFTVPGSTISPTLNNNRYVRYKAFLSTVDPSLTPVMSSLSMNYVSGCAAPGQAMFAGLAQGNDYELEISMPGYQTQTLNNISISGYNTVQILLSQ